LGEGYNDPSSKDLFPPDIPTLVQRCLKVEQDRSLFESVVMIVQDSMNSPSGDIG
jgi:hypothetical protein